MLNACIFIERLLLKDSFYTHISLHLFEQLLQTNSSAEFIVMVRVKHVLLSYSSQSQSERRL
jgi:hypothetical protein